MDIFSPQNLVNLIGGGLILFFLIWQGIEKAFGNIGWIKNHIEKKESIQLQKKEKEITRLVKEIILPPFLKEVEEMNNKQNIKLDNLLKSTNDTMRIELLRIFFRYSPYKKIPQWAKESAVQLYEDYRAQEGNSFVQDLWQQISEWEIVSSENDL